MTRRSTALLIAAVTAGGTFLATTSTASAATAPNPSCVAVFVHGPAGPPGLFESQVHIKGFGSIVSFVAHLDCSG